MLTELDSGWKCFHCGRHIRTAYWLQTADFEMWWPADACDAGEESFTCKPFGRRCVQRVHYRKSKLRGLAKDLREFFAEAQHNRHLIEEYGEQFVDRAQHLQDLESIIADCIINSDWCAQKDWQLVQKFLKQTMETKVNWKVGQYADHPDKS